MICVSGYSQVNVEQQRIKLKQDGWMILTLGGFGHVIGNVYFFYGHDLSERKYRNNFIICNTYGLSLDVLAFYKFRKAKKLTHKPRF
jgi:hypothetical protein